jgi:hypothetical protein
MSAANTGSTPSRADALAGRDCPTASGAVRGGQVEENVIFCSLVLVKSAAGEPHRWALKTGRFIKSVFSHGHFKYRHCVNQVGCHNNR